MFVALHRSRYRRAPGGDRLSAPAVADVVKQAAARAGAAGNFAGHSLRRGPVTSEIDTGVPLEQVMRHARHANVRSTLGYAERRTARHPSGRGARLTAADFRRRAGDRDG